MAFTPFHTVGCSELPQEAAVRARVAVDPSDRSVIVDFGGGETAALDRIGRSVYVTFDGRLGQLTSIQVFDDAGRRDPAWFDTIRALAGPTLTDTMSRALTGSVPVDVEISVPDAEATELRAGWAELHPLIARRLGLAEPWPPMSWSTAWTVLASAVAVARIDDEGPARLIVPEGLAGRAGMEPELPVWTDAGRIWTRATASRRSAEGNVDVRLVDPDCRPWVPLSLDRRTLLGPVAADLDPERVTANTVVLVSVR